MTLPETVINVMSADSHPDDYWQQTLKSAKYVVAPMVDQSELAWRLLARRHGADLCYTPMLHASNFAKEATYRRDHFQTCAEDRPLIAQFCANDPNVFLEAARFVAPFCDGIDLNIGCPQAIAKRGHYGAFLQEEWELLASLVHIISTELPDCPISCKIRIYPEIEKTVAYAQMLEAAGCKLLAVHGREIWQKGPVTGLASWEHIKAVKNAVRIPVFANGNIQFFDDVDRCIRETGVEGVMSAEGHLHNPTIFETRNTPPHWELASEYLSLVLQYPCPFSYVRAHLFKLFHHSLAIFTDLRDVLAAASELGECERLCVEIKRRCLDDHQKYLENASCDSSLAVPHWICQPYERPIPLALSENTESGNRKRTQPQNAWKSKVSDAASQILSEKSCKRQRLKPMKPKHRFVLCICASPAGRCDYEMCKNCCKAKCIKTNATCAGHNIRCRKFDASTELSS